MTASDWLALSPVVAMAVVALGAFALDAVLGVTWRGRQLGALSWLPWIMVAGLLVPLVLVLNLWYGWVGDPPSEASLFGTFDADRFTLFFQLVILIATALVLVASVSYLRQLEGSRGEFIGLMLIAATGMMLLVGASELITIYVALETTALPVVAMIAIRRDAHAIEGAIKFLVLSAMSTALLLFGFVLLYGFTGATQLADIAERVQSLAAGSDDPFGGYALMLSLLLIVGGFGFKMAIAPWQMWVPDVYQGAPAPVAAFLSVASKASAFAVVMRILLQYSSTGAETQDWQLLFAVVAAVSMSVGNLMALSQTNVKRLLGYSTIAQAGYITIGLAALLGGSSGGGFGSGAEAALYYLAGYAFTNLAVFLGYAALLHRIDDDTIDGLRGMFRRSRAMTILLVIGLLSLLGMPPTVGFMAKAVIFSGAVSEGMVWLAVVAVLNTVVAAFYYLRVVGVMMFSEPAEDAGPVDASRPELAAVAVGVAGALLLGVLPVIVLDLADSAIKSV